VQENDIAVQVALNSQRMDLLGKEMGEFKVEIKGSLDRNNEVLKELHDKIDSMILSISVTQGKHEERIESLEDGTAEKFKAIDSRIGTGIGAMFTVFVTMLGAAASYFFSK
jgi:hypothetical protein